MRSIGQPDLRATRRPRFWAASLLCGLLAGSHSALAGSISENHPEGDAHACACGMKCKPGRCCCAPHRKAAAPKKADNADRSGPCLDSSPCGDPASPAPVVPSAKMAILSASDRPDIRQAGGTRIPIADESAASPCPDRLDDPPDPA